jgi:hypothetical protein
MLQSLRHLQSLSRHPLETLIGICNIYRRPRSQNKNMTTGFLFEEGKRKYYTLKGNEFCRFTDSQSSKHEKRAKIDKYTQVVNRGCEKSLGVWELELVHPKWPKTWVVGAGSEVELKTWIGCGGRLQRPA